MSGRKFLDLEKIELILQRLSCELVENHGDFSDTVVLGLQPRGTFLSEKIVNILKSDYEVKDIHLGKLDITFYRDDFRRRGKPLSTNSTDIDFIIENKKVIFIDDVLFTGRTVNSALTAVQSYGRPSKIELLVLIERRFNRQLPIRPDYKGVVVDTIEDEVVQIYWSEEDLLNGAYISNRKNK